MNISVLNSLQRGGIEVHTRQILEAMEGICIKPEVLAIQLADGDLRDLYEASGYTVTGWRTNFNSLLPGILRSVLYLRAKRPDVVHLHHMPSAFYVVFGLYVLGMRPRIIKTIHNTKTRPRNLLKRWLKQWTWSRAEVLVCISEGVRQDVLQWVPDAAEKTVVVYNGCDVATLSEIGRRRLPAVHDPRRLIRFLSIGRCHIQKAYDVLLRALAKVERVELKIAGSGPDEESLKALAVDLGVNGRVDFLGWREDIPDLLGDADVYVQSSRWEGFGVATVQAMVAGLPVITSNVEGLAEVVGDAGLTFPNEDAEALASCMRKLRDDPDLRSRLGVNCYERGIQFDVRRCAAKLRSIYMGA